MKYSQNDKQRITDYYNNLFAKYGDDDPRALGWVSDKTQGARFKILSEVGDLSNKSVLDIGCGFGDLHGYLSNLFKEIRYLGIDINEKAISVARKKYQNTSFEVMDFNNYNGGEFDYTIASGIFSFKAENFKEMYLSETKKMFDNSTMGTAFNMLNKKHHVDNDLFATFSPSEVYDFCASFTDKIVLRQDYLEQDFTMYLYH